MEASLLRIYFKFNLLSVLKKKQNMAKLVNDPLLRTIRTEKNTFVVLWMPPQTKESYWMKLNKKQSLFRIYAF